MKSKKQRENGKKTVIEHLEDVRRLLIIILISFTIATIFFFNLSELLIEKLTNSVEIILVSLFDYFITKFIISSYLSLLILLPFWFLLIGKFLYPAKDMKIVKIILKNRLIILTLFYIAFLCNLIIFYFLLKTVKYPTGLKQLAIWFIRLHFAIFIGFIFSLIFSIKRKVYYVISFIIGAIFTPPDVISQIILASIFILFYELIALIKFFFRKEEKTSKIKIEKNKKELMG